MSSMPAAAAEAGSGHVPLDLHTRLWHFLARTCGDDGRRLAERLLPASTSDPESPDQGFFWLLIPEWLAEDAGLTETTEGRALVADLLWVQYCVWAVFRIQDDLVDGEEGHALLAVQANHLLVEAARRAAQHFRGDSPFWRIFQETIDATARALVCLDRLQRTPDRPPHIEQELYADLSACLKIATGGVMVAAGREQDWERCMSPALDGLAVAAQILDDLRDISDDLREGRINYAAWYLSRPIFSPVPEAIEAVVASNLAIGDRLPGLLAEVKEQVDGALRALAPSPCSRAHAHLREFRRGIQVLGERFRRSRVERISPLRWEPHPAAVVSSPRPPNTV